MGKDGVIDVTQASDKLLGCASVPFLVLEHFPDFSQGTWQPRIMTIFP
jgi:hypothetical protein